MIPLSRLRRSARKLAHFAGLEHALCVEYLFARYSLNVPERAGRIAGGGNPKVRAAQEIYSIAQDEMSHLWWVNEALWILGKEPCVNRPEKLSDEFARKFELRPLTPNVLAEFIAVEAPSSIIHDDPQQLDSAYSKIFLSLYEITGDADTLLRLKQIVKVIMDEGKRHWERFRLVQASLGLLHPDAYLRFTKCPPRATTEPCKTLEKLCDVYYDFTLQMLYSAFRFGRFSRGLFMLAAQCAMQAFDDIAFLLLERNGAPKFMLPTWIPGPPPHWIRRV